MSLRRTRRRADLSVLPTGPFPSDPTQAGHIFDARLHLLDRQVVDTDGEPVMVVDDIEVLGVDHDDLPGDVAPPTVDRLLAGSTLGTRIFGGQPPESRLEGVPWSSVSGVDVVVTVSIPAEELDITWRERWLRQHVIGRILGGKHDPQ